MYGTTAELSMNPAEKEGQAKGFQGPPGMGGGPRSESLPDFDGLDTFENVRPVILSVSLTSG